MDKLEVAKKCIADNLDKVLSAYTIGYQQACFGFHQIGLKTAFEKVNELLPENFREGMTIAEATILNTEIQCELERMLRNNP